MEPVAEYVLLRVGAGRYAVPMSDVGEIGRAPEVTRLPGVASFVAGMANWRGAALAIVDARTLLGAPTLSAPTHVAVLRRDDVELGLLVDDMDGTLVADGVLASVPASVPPATAVLLSGTLVDPAGRSIAVLDAAAIVGLGSRLR